MMLWLSIAVVVLKNVKKKKFTEPTRAFQLVQTEICGRGGNALLEFGQTSC